MIATLQGLDAPPRDLWLYDTFELVADARVLEKHVALRIVPRAARRRRPSPAGGLDSTPTSALDAVLRPSRLAMPGRYHADNAVLPTPCGVAALISPGSDPPH
jgi:hypothetical protein